MLFEKRVTGTIIMIKYNAIELILVSNLGIVFSSFFLILYVFNASLF